MSFPILRRGGVYSVLSATGTERHPVLVRQGRRKKDRYPVRIIAGKPFDVMLSKWQLMAVHSQSVGGAIGSFKKMVDMPCYLTSRAV